MFYKTIGPLVLLWTLFVVPSLSAPVPLPLPLPLPDPVAFPAPNGGTMSAFNIIERRSDTHHHEPFKPDLHAPSSFKPDHPRPAYHPPPDRPTYKPSLTTRLTSFASRVVEHGKNKWNTAVENRMRYDQSKKDGVPPSYIHAPSWKQTSQEHYHKLAVDGKKQHLQEQLIDHRRKIDAKTPAWTTSHNQYGHHDPEQLPAYPGPPPAYSP